MIAAFVKPLVLTDTSAQIVTYGSFACAWLVEVAHSVEARQSIFVKSDRGTYRVYVISIAAAIFIALSAGKWVPVLSLSSGGVWPLVLGLGLFWAGALLRWWAIFTLGHLFTVVVVVQDDHRVITTGPYRFIRHPGYMGLWLMLVGIGFIFDNLLGVLACLLLPPIGMFIRIRVEEQLLENELGNDYLGYEATTKRLIPGVW